jgi:hypothetical protein
MTTLLTQQNIELMLAAEDRMNACRSRAEDAQDETGPAAGAHQRAAQADLDLAEALYDLIANAAEIRVTTYEELAATAGANTPASLADNTGRTGNASLAATTSTTSIETEGELA